jgi:hypothetical protein
MEPPDSPAPELDIDIIAPEEFVGISMAELAAHQGVVKGLNSQGKNVVIHGGLPASAFEYCDQP